MSTARPVIGVTSPNRGAWPAWFLTKLLIWWAGGRPVHISPRHHFPVENLDGLILGGGADIDPALYREKVLQTVKAESKQVRRWSWKIIFSIFIWLFRKLFSLNYTMAHEDKARDELEFKLLDQALKKNIPVLGICRGAQLINVYFGGSLHQDISHFYTEQPELRTILAKVTILLEPHTKLHDIFKRRFTKVNSLHHQSVKELGKDLKVAAKEPVGIIEAIEHTQRPFVIGVQWHPEFLPFNPMQRKLFRSLVSFAKKVSP